MPRLLPLLDLARPCASPSEVRLPLRSSASTRPAVVCRLAVISCCAASLVVALAGPASTARADQLHAAGSLDQFAFVAFAGLEPWRADREQLLAQARSPWAWGDAGGVYRTHVTGDGDKACHPTGEPGKADHLKDGGPDVYARALAHRTAFKVRRDMLLAREARARLLDLMTMSGFHGPDGRDLSGDNQCVLDLATSIPIWIASAELLEETGAWSVSDRVELSLWLEREVYPLVAWASRTRRNNWGAAGSLAARMIARYVAPYRLVLFEKWPSPRALLASQAVREHDQMQLARIGRDWPGDTRCPHFGIQDHGGIPDELRRGAGGCAAVDLPSAGDASHNYQTMHVALLVLHAEVMRIEGDASLFEAATAAGDRALLQSILFVIDNPGPGGRSWDWGLRTGALRVAARYYGDPRLAAQVDANAALGFRGGRIYPYTQIQP